LFLLTARLLTEQEALEPPGVRIRDGKIADIGVLKVAPNETRLDVKGLIVSPGFIDLESGDINSAT
jgi:predicted amidohydrolase